jgi:hypothetical protein
VQQHTLSQQLQAQDPNSPYSRVIQNSVSPTLKAIGWTDAQIKTLPAEAAQDAAKNGLSYADTQAKYGLEKAIHEETIGLQKSQLENTKEYQKGQQDIERENQKLQHPWQNFLKKIGIGGDNSSVPDGRVTVISPTGQIGHIPQTQLKDALLKGYKQQ